MVFPVTRVNPEIDRYEGDFKPWNDKDQYVHDLCETFRIDKTSILLSNYKIDKDPEIYRDVPISLQLVGRRYEEEKVCR